MQGEHYRNGGVEITVTRRDDGSMLLDNAEVLPPLAETLPSRLAKWASETPGAIFLSEGGRELSYQQAERQRAELAGRVLHVAGASGGILILGVNGINHALVMLAATSVGVPVAVVSPAYLSMAAAPWTKFSRVLDQFSPAVIFADRPELVQPALQDLGKAISVFPLQDLAAFKQIETAGARAVLEAEERVGPDTVAKLLFTSGSTGIPKAVPNTQRMMVSNLQAVELIWPFLAEVPPVLVDWLPWNHTFGGNFCFDIALWFGGRMHVDQGKPTPQLLDLTISALRQVKPTIYFSTPLGYDLLIARLEQDPVLARSFFSGLKFAFNAGAALPTAVRTRLEQLWLVSTGTNANIVGGWGSTETAPFATVLPFDTDHANNLGVPIPGTTVKLVPDFQPGRYELRVRGPNVMDGYWNDLRATASAFDEEGFYKIGDAGRFADPTNPAFGILFDGRVAENFKLTSGTFVNVGAVRLSIISACKGLVSDAVIAGEGRSEIGVLLFPNRSACLSHAELEADSQIALSDCEAVIGCLRERLKDQLSAGQGSSMRVSRFLVLDEPPSAAEDEITDKGYLNQRRILSRRAHVVEELYHRGMRI